MSIKIGAIGELGRFVMTPDDFTNYRSQLSWSKRFLQKIDRTQFHRAYCVGYVTIGGNNYWGGRDAFFPDQAQKFQTVGTRHPQVENRQVKQLIMQQLNRFFG